MTTFRRLRTVIGLSFEASPSMSLLVLAFEAIAFSSLLLVAFALKLLIDAAVQHSSSNAIAGAIVASVALVACIGWLPIGASLSLRLQERIQVALDRRLMDLSARLPTLQHLDGGQFATNLQLLMNDDRFPLGGGLITLGAVAAYIGLLVAACVILGVQHPALVIVPIAILPLLWVSHRADMLWERTRRSVAPDQQMAFELYRIATTPDVGKELRVFDIGDELLARHEAAETRVRRALSRANWRATLIRSATWLAFAAGYVLAVLVTTQRAADGKATAGDVVLVITVALPIVLLAGTAGPYLSVLTRLSAAADRLVWMADAVTASVPKPGARRPPPHTLVSGIRLEGVHFAYGESTEPAVREIALDLPAGGVLALVGDNGAGKSTIVKLLCGLYAPTEGRVTVDGVDLNDIDHEQWRDRICAGFQDFVHFEFLAGESIGVGDLGRLTQREALDEALSRGGATDVVATLPDGLQTQLGRTWTDGAELSTGQWQKLALSRGLMRDEPLLVVLDEPTAALDPTAEEQLFRQFAQAAATGRRRGTVTVLVSHRFSTVRFADTIAVVEAGRLTEVGSHEDLMSRGGTYAELFTLQSRQYQ